MSATTTTSSIVLIDATSDSLTVSWPEDKNGKANKRYVLQYRRIGAKKDDDDGTNAPFETLSNALTTPLARKKNLVDAAGTGFLFRVGFYNGDGADPYEWTSHEEPFHLLSVEQERDRMAAPVIHLGGSNSSLRIAWTAKDETSQDTDAVKALQYELQMRENVPGVDWTMISDSLHGTEVRKKNLTSLSGYQFRVRSNGVAQEAFSPPSDSVVALGYSKGLEQLFPNQLLAPQSKTSTPSADVLGGKEFVLLYASAHWCGPCRQFTPKLAQWYQSLGMHSTVEVVFLSADRDTSSFQSYYASMPWAAVSFDDEKREQLMSHIRVSGIPRLVVLDGRTGRIIEDNAVGKALDVNRWRNLLTK